MTRRQSGFAYASLLIGVTAFASSFARPSSGQQAAPVTVGEGRYRATETATGNQNDFFVTDSVTGRTWMHQNGEPWLDLGTPVAPK